MCLMKLFEAFSVEVAVLDILNILLSAVNVRKKQKSRSLVESQSAEERFSFF
jgi:hypothetical protein